MNFDLIKFLSTLTALLKFFYDFFQIESDFEQRFNLKKSFNLSEKFEDFF